MTRKRTRSTHLRGAFQFTSDEPSAAQQSVCPFHVSRGASPGPVKTSPTIEIFFTGDKRPRELAGGKNAEGEGGGREKGKGKMARRIRAVRLRAICRLFPRLGVDDGTEVGDFHPSALLYTFYPLCRAAVLKCKCAVASYYAKRPMRSLRPMRCPRVCAPSPPPPPSSP